MLWLLYSFWANQDCHVPNTAGYHANLSNLFVTIFTSFGYLMSRLMPNQKQIRMCQSTDTPKLIHLSFLSKWTFQSPSLHSLQCRKFYLPQNYQQKLNNQSWFMFKCTVAMDHCNHYYYFYQWDWCNRMLASFRIVHYHCMCAENVKSSYV